MNILQPISLAPFPPSPQKTYIPFIDRKPMIHPRRQNQQVPRLSLNPNPLVFSIPYVKESAALQDISDLFILMHMLIVKRLDLVLVSCPERVGGDGDFVAVDVIACRGDVFQFEG